MPRLILFLLFVLLAGWAAWTIASGSAGRTDGERAARTFRPRRRLWAGWTARARRPASDKRMVHLVPRQELSGLRDALSSASLDAQDDLYRCGNCLAFYGRESAVALDEDNSGRCAVCGSSDLAPVRVIDD